jgi:glucosamine--fructose-6-phosphate aminotransferase (isomerizing)
MKNRLIEVILKLCSWKIFFGRSLKNLPEKSAVIFPLQNDMLYCGLAGILAFKGEKTDNALIERFSQLSARICSMGMEKAGTQEFLGGDSLKELENVLFSIKQDIAFQYRINTDGGLESLRNLSDRLDAFMQEQEQLLEQKASEMSVKDVEMVSGRLIKLKDISWGLREDLLRNQDKIKALANEITGPAQFAKYQRLNFILNAMDRLEVRGRDSTGVQIAFDVEKAALDKILGKIKSAGLDDEFLERTALGDLMNRSISMSGGFAAFTYKTASITGELGKNCRELRGFISSDRVLQAFLSEDGTDEMYLAHTRWASVGAINIPNCHPVNNCTICSAGTVAFEKAYPRYGSGKWFINVALNGDIDNYLDIRSRCESSGRLLDPKVTTDTKAIPIEIERHLLDGCDLKEAFRRAVSGFEGSHAIAMESNLEPGRIYLALHGSGQSLFIGISENQYSFASEVYGLVEETPKFIKMDGETPRIPGDGSTSGQIFILDSKGGGLAGIEALSYDDHRINLDESILKNAEITTRDIDRGIHAHYLIKEIMDSPSSVKKTLRGKYRISGNEVFFNLGTEVISEKTRRDLTGGMIRNIFVIGQGTAAVAGTAIAEAMDIYLKKTHLNIQAKKASDLSGFTTDEELSQSLVIAVTQSGTTTDTNRAVTMAREKGASIIAIVNRRQSDITTKAHGVLYTSDGRDIEMSVASTKAFYSQIAAGYVLTLFLAKLMEAIPDEKIARELEALERAPMLMNRVISRMDEIKKTAWDMVRFKKYWAVVGSGTNKVAADEVRIKLSELCYKTISSDIIEDKKHIDLSAEPLILVMAAGSPEIVLEDIVKDTAIFKAHASRVVVIADEDERRFDHVADHVFNVPRASFPVSVIMNTIAGHIWGYYAATSLDEQAGHFRDFRIRLSDVLAGHEAEGMSIFESMADRELHRVVDDFAQSFNSWRGIGHLASLNVDTATDLTLLLKYATGKIAPEEFRKDFKGRKASSPLDMLDITLGRAIDELARPVDAIRHQAKTVTVGTSRKTESLKGIMFDELARLGFTTENLTQKDILDIKRIQPAVSRVAGHAVYRLTGLDIDGMPTDSTMIRLEKKGGVASGLKSRADDGAPLMGTKRAIIKNREIYAGSGRSDRASIVIIGLLGPSLVPEQLVLFHVEFEKDLSIHEKERVLGDKLGDIRNWLNEENIAWDGSFISKLPIELLLGEAPEVVAEIIKKEIKNG